MTVAERTRAAVRERPFLYDALRAGVVNYAAAAATLDVDADADAVATALRRFADDLDGEIRADADARVRMERGVGRIEDVDLDAGVATTGDAGDEGDDGDDDPALRLAVGGTAYVADAGDATAIVASGDVGARALERALARLRVAGVSVDAAGVTQAGVAVVVNRRAGADALRAVEAALSRS